MPNVKELITFVDYVWSFYGEHSDTIYPIKGLEKRHIWDAYFTYKDRILKGDEEYAHYSWGDGDSLDRERVRDIILENQDSERELTTQEQIDYINSNLKEV